MSQSQTSSPPPASSSESPPAAPKESKDMVLVHGRTADGRGLSVLRLRDQHLEAGAVMPLVPGKPIYGDVVRLKPRQELPLLFDVQVDYSAPTSERGSPRGPAQVATDSYRENWDAIWARSAEPDDASN